MYVPHIYIVWLPWVSYRGHDIDLDARGLGRDYVRAPQL